MLDACQIALVLGDWISTLPAHAALKRDTQMSTLDPFSQPSLMLLLLVPGVSQLILNRRHRECWHLKTECVALRMPRAATEATHPGSLSNFCKRFPTSSSQVSSSPRRILPSSTNSGAFLNEALGTVMSERENNADPQRFKRVGGPKRGAR